MTLPISRENRFLLLSSCAAIIAFTLPSTAAQAAGFYIQEQSVSGLGTAFAGSGAVARDASVLHYNPAAITQLDGRQLNVGVHMLYPSIEVQDNGTTIGGFSLDALGRPNSDGGNPGGLANIPNVYFATPLDDTGKFWFGAGISAPFGLKSEYNDEFFGRFVSQKSELRTIDVQPTLAYQVNDQLSLGATVIGQYARANLKQSLPNEVDVSLVGDDFSLGYNIGALYSPWAGTDIGVSYRSEINHNASGRQTTSTGAALGPDSQATAKIKLPEIASLSVAQDLDKDWTLLGSLNYYGWNNFDELRVVPDNAATVGPVVDFSYENSFAYSVGLEYEMDEQWTLRTGYQYDQTPTRDATRSTLNPDGDRHWFAGGATYTLDERLSFDFGATYIDIEEGTIDQTRAGVANVKARTEDGYVGIVSMGLNYKF